MSNYQVFNYNGNDIRVVDVGGEPWFVGKDVKGIMGYKNGCCDIGRYVQNSDCVRMKGLGEGLMAGTIMINESGLIALINASHVPYTLQFRHWLTSELLPSFHRRNVYSTPVSIEQIIENPDFGIRLLTELKEERKRKNALEAARGCRHKRNKKRHQKSASRIAGDFGLGNAR